MKNDTGVVFAFDLGKGSLGEAVRKDKDIVHAESFLFPPDFASTKDQASRRRAKRTREAHKAREEWLKEQCRQAGIEVLEGRSTGDASKGVPAREHGDPRLEREFAAPNDSTCYTSCLLRIKLLRGEKLEGWQVYKALHSAIQRRGYERVPWAAREEKRSGSKQDDDEKKNASRLSEFQALFASMTPSREDRQYLCYFDAWRMGLWNPVTDELQPRLTNAARRARNFLIPRPLVEKELRALLEKAALQFPKLKGKVDLVMYGPAGTPYASYYANLRQKYGLRRGATTDWQGALSQKIPRFDNRIIAHCALIPRFNVCRSDDPLTWQVTFLMSLHRMRYFVDGHEKRLTVDEIRELFAEAQKDDAKRKAKDKAKPDAETKPTTRPKAWAMTESAWKKWCDRHGGAPVVNQNEVEAPRAGGRSRFSRPALRVLRDLILSGESPHAYHKKALAALPEGMVDSDLGFLLRMPDAWELIHIPDDRTSFSGLNRGERLARIRALIGEQRDPVVRHRLGVFHQRLEVLEHKWGQPDSVAIEFVREDFMGEKALKRLEEFQKKRREERKRAREQAAELTGDSGGGATLRMELLRQQNGRCLYTGDALGETEVLNYHIDHIVPRGSRYSGSDAMFNKVLTTDAANKEKGEQTPYEWLHGSGKWQAYLQRVQDCAGSLGRKKAALLTSENANELDERYTALAETAWISRVARRIACLHFGWDEGELKGAHRKVQVLSGGLTARARRKYDLDSLLHPPTDDPDLMEKKCRENKRHHALDAMVLAYLQEWARNPGKERFFRLPEGIARDYFKERLENVLPRFLARAKPVLEEMIYAKRKVDGEEKMVRRIKLLTLPGGGREFNAKKGWRAAGDILDHRIRDEVQAFLAGNPTEEQWRQFCTSYRLVEGGAAVERVAVSHGEPKEYGNLSKDGTNQHKRGKTHRGYFVYLDTKGCPEMRSVYAFESIATIRRQLQASGAQIVDYFYANCPVILEKPIVKNNRVIGAGSYLCSMKSDGRVKLKQTQCEGIEPQLTNEISLSDVLAAGLRKLPNP